MNTAERRAVAALWTVQGVGALGLKQARAALGDLGAHLAVPVDRWRQKLPARVGNRLAEDGVRSLAHRADALERRLKAVGYRVAFPGDPAWPSRLDELADPPPLLFHLGPGAAASPRRRLAMVGTRRPDRGFDDWAKALAGQVARCGVGVVSGAAVGVDQLCHTGALDAQGETWAFLGCAIEQVDDAQGVMRERFAKHGGTFFSEYPPGARSEKGTFPRRNRLISGAADAVLVLRAKLGSGTKYTVEAAEKQGRPLLAVPGDPFNPVAAYPNQLLGQGRARPCLNVQDVLRAVGLEGTRTPPPPPPTAPAVDPAELSPAAQVVYQGLGPSTLDVDELAGQVAGVASGAIMAALVELELFGLVVQKPGRRYERADRSRSFVDEGGGAN